VQPAGASDRKDPLSDCPAWEPNGHPWADIPAGGKTSARAIARMYAALLGEVDGVRLISPERLRETTAVSI